MSRTRENTADLQPTRMRDVLRQLITAGAALGLWFVTACASGGFRHSPNTGDLARAATALNADSALLNNEKIVFQAAMLYSLPNRGSYNPARARALFERLLNQFPRTSMRQTAADQLAMLYEVERVRNEGLTERQSLQSRIAALESDTVTLHRSLDSVTTRLNAEQDQNAVLRKATSRLESDLQDRESQLTALQAELNHLKAIDLHPPMRTQSRDTAIRKPRRPL
ncbi:MAG: hypothetical protein ABI026_00850 [Gemmatimonadaceae bacterium]